MKRTREQRIITALFLTPALFLFTVFVALPGVRALLYSVQKWDGLGEAEWAGLNNFRTLFGDDLFFPALKNNVILMVGAGSITLVLALFFASLIPRGVRGADIFRVVFFFPNIVASVAVALIWLLLYSTTGFGAINALLGFVHRSLTAALETMPKGNSEGLLDALQGLVAAFGDALPYAFTDTSHLIYALIPMMVWTSVGFYMILFLAAMQSIPEELYEAATLDGATPRQQFFGITLPLIREVFIVGIVFFIISSAKFFDAIWVLENQYPTKDSHVLATVLYQKVFTEYNIGYAAAVAVVLFVLVFLATLITLRWSRKEALEY